MISWWTFFTLEIYSNTSSSSPNRWPKRFICKYILWEAGGVQKKLHNWPHVDQAEGEFSIWMLIWLAAEEGIKESGF